MTEARRKESASAKVIQKAVPNIKATAKTSRTAGRASGKPVLSTKAPEPVGPYPHARQVGDLLFLSGVGPRQRGSSQIPGVKLDETGCVQSYDIEAQCHSVFKNVRWILEEAGSSWDELVDVTVYLTNIEKDFLTYNKIYAEYFKDRQPCRTTLGIVALPTPIAIELKCIATVGRPPKTGGGRHRSGQKGGKNA